MLRRRVNYDTPTKNPILPIVKTEVWYLLYEETETSIKIKTISRMTQERIAFFSVDSVMEFLTPSPESNQVVLRASNKQNWTSRPWALTPIIEWYSDY